jgi:hypothetical protein
MEKELKVDFNTLLSFTKCLIKLAQLNTLIPEEKEYIKTFFENTALEIGVKDNFETIFKSLEDSEINEKDLKNLSVSEELKEYFFKTCVFLACIDYFSDEEKDFIKDLALKLNFNKLNKVIEEVKNEIFKDFNKVEIFKNSLDKIKALISL